MPVPFDPSAPVLMFDNGIRCRCTTEPVVEGCDPPQVLARQVAFDSAPCNDFTSCAEVLLLEGGGFQVLRTFRIYQGGKSSG